MSRLAIDLAILLPLWSAALLLAALLAVRATNPWGILTRLQLRRNVAARLAAQAPCYSHDTAVHKKAQELRRGSIEAKVGRSNSFQPLTHFDLSLIEVGQH